MAQILPAAIKKVEAVFTNTPNNDVIDPETILKELSSEEKIALLSGDDMWHTAPVKRLGVPRVRCSDGPNGLRGTAWTNGAPASCFPCATGLGASFDVELANRIGEALGDEARARGVHCILGPTTNIQRHPLGGRGFESFSEDPHLSGYMALAWIKGVQSRKVMTNPKHFFGNEQEHYRRSNNSVMDERTMHEIYLEPFRIQMKANPAVFMPSYNKVNGKHVTEQPYLLRKVLRGDFGFKGMLMSDWSGTTGGWETIKASLDLEMPGPAIVRGSVIERDIVCGRLKTSDIDECVLRVLNYVKEAQLSGIPFEAEEGTTDSPPVRALLREAANAGTVLLKNSSQVLPVNLKKGMKIAVIGPNAKFASYAGGGSAYLAATYKITPFEAITKAAAEVGASVEYTIGADASRFAPLLSDYLSMPEGVNEPGCVVSDFYTENPWQGKKVERIFRKCNNSAFTYYIDGIPTSIPVRGYVSLRTIFTPDVSGKWLLGLGVSGQADLYVDGKKLIDNRTNQSEGLLFFMMGAEERFGELEVEAGRKYEIEVRFSNFKQLNSHSPYSGRRGGIRIGGRPNYDPKAEIAKAVKLSQDSDVTLVCVGTNNEWESESYDRIDMKLPPGTDDLISSILAVTPKAIIVNQSGMPVEMPWLSKATTVLQAFFGGNECGSAVSDVIFGNTNPSGKLPITWSEKLEDWPSNKEGYFGDNVTTTYGEGLEVGYRYFDRPGKIRSLFPFGFGLSYTAFKFSDLEVKAAGPHSAEVSFTITNTGTLSGAEVGQVYVHSYSPSVERPDIELGGFAKAQLQPGESKKLNVHLDHKAFSYYSVNEKAWIADKGMYEIRLGSSSTAIHMVKPFNLENTWTWIGNREPERLSYRD